MISINLLPRTWRFASVLAAFGLLCMLATSSIAAAKTSTTDVRLYFLVDGKIAAATRGVDASDGLPERALTDLLAGPSMSELAVGLRTALPVGLELADPLTIDAKTKHAVVSLPSIFTSDDAAVEAERTAEIVYTLTQFSGINSVLLNIGGSAYAVLNGDEKRASGPVGRADYEALTPAILIESPSAGASSANPLHVTGTANAFEGQFMIALYDASNKKIASQSVMATSGSGTRGTFDTTLDYTVKEAGLGSLVAYELSAKDGSVTDLTAVPVILTAK